jgi:hypothetical protein
MKSALALSEAKTIERFERREAKRSKRGYGATAEFAAGSGELFPRLVDHIQVCLQKPDDLTSMLREIGPRQLALEGLDSLMHSVVIGRKQPALAIELGKAVQGALWAAGLLKNNPKRLKKIGQINDTGVRMRAAWRAGYRQRDWSEERKLRVGIWLLNCCVEALPDVFEALSGGMIDVRDEARDRFLSLRELVMWADPVIVPCTEAPKPWTDWCHGGFWDERTRLRVAFVRTHHRDTKEDIRRAFRDGSMKQHVDGVNALQDVPWRINEPVLEAVKLYADRLRDAGKLKVAPALLQEDMSA